MVKNEALLPLFGKVKALLEPYAKRLTVHRDEPGYYDLWSEKDLVIEGRKRHDVFFAGLIIQKSYVGFHFMCVYAEPGIKAVLGPQLLATLKGKSCFHIRELTPDLERQIEAALATGYRRYQERGWV